MYVRNLVLAATVFGASLIAHADTFTSAFTANGTAQAATINSLYIVNSTLISQFNPSLGTLNSVTLLLTGNAAFTSPIDFFAGVGVTTNTSNLYFAPFQFASQSPFVFSVNDTTSFGLAALQGTGTQSLFVGFTDPTITTGTSGTLTYNYTPIATAVTPEPSSFVFLATGLLGVAGIMRKRFA